MQFAIFAGLGNQLFQFSLAHEMAAQGQKVSLVIDGNPQVDRPFELNRLLDQCSHIADYRIANFREVKGRNRFQSLIRYLPARIQAQIKSKLHLNYEIHEFAFDYKQLHPTRLNVGYFQNWRYVANSWESFGNELLALISKESNLPLINDLDLSNLIVIHVRRGDLIQSKDTMGLLSPKYYANALSSLKVNLMASKLIIVTDDVKNAKDVADYLGVTQILGPHELTAWQSLSLMANCKYLITANSTLSWWGAFLNNKFGGVSVLPDPWFKKWPRDIGDAFNFPGAILQEAEYV